MKMIFAVLIACSIAFSAVNAQDCSTTADCFCGGAQGLQIADATELQKCKDDLAVDAADTAKFKDAAKAMEALKKYKCQDQAKYTTASTACKTTCAALAVPAGHTCPAGGAAPAGTTKAAGSGGATTRGPNWANLCSNETMSRCMCVAFADAADKATCESAFKKVSLVYGRAAHPNGTRVGASMDPDLLDEALVALESLDAKKIKQAMCLKMGDIENCFLQANCSLGAFADYEAYVKDYVKNYLVCTNPNPEKAGPSGKTDSKGGVTKKPKKKSLSAERNASVFITIVACISSSALLKFRDTFLTN